MPNEARSGRSLPDGRSVEPNPPTRNPADDCVHCGFCLPTCPTWQNWQEEMDSPRGRIDLFRALSDGRLRMSPAVAEHFDRCLGCMACVTACPSGVRYDHVIDAARARVEREHPRGLADRAFRGLLFAIFPWPGRLRAVAAVLWLLRVTGLQRLLRRVGLLRAFPRLAALEALAPPMALADVTATLPARVAPVGDRRLRAGLLTGCVQRVFFRNVNEATLRVLAAEGVEVVVPAGQGCCGALSIHAGREDESRRMAVDLLDRFEREPLDVVVANAAGCGAHLKDLPRLFPDDPALRARAEAFAAKVRDVAEVVAALTPRAPRAPLRSRIAYHSPCHLTHAQRAGDAPRAMLRTIPGLELVEIADGDQCCGAAGIYNLVEPESAGQVGRRKADAVLATHAPLLASANPGCTLQIQRLLDARGAVVEAAHPIEILDRAIAAARQAKPE